MAAARRMARDGAGIEVASLDWAKNTQGLAGSSSVVAPNLQAVRDQTASQLEAHATGS